MATTIMSDFNWYSAYVSPAPLHTTPHKFVKTHHWRMSLQCNTWIQVVPAVPLAGTLLHVLAFCITSVPTLPVWGYTEAVVVVSYQVLKSSHWYTHFWQNEYWMKNEHWMNFHQHQMPKSWTDLHHLFAYMCGFLFWADKRNSVEMFSNFRKWFSRPQNKIVIRGSGGRINLKYR